MQLLAIPAIIVYFMVRIFKKKSFGSWRERFGFVPATKHQDTVIWLHAVSVGEVASIEYFIALLRKERPDLICYLTCGTVAGMQTAKKIGAGYVSFMPFDFLVPMLIAFKRIKPRALIIVEAEIWPNFLMLAHFKKIPLFLLNGRINPISERSRHAIGFLYRLFTKIFVPSQRTWQQFASLGVAHEKIKLLGDIKAFNVVEKKAAYRACEPTKHTIVLVGSIHSGELDVYLDAYLKLKMVQQNARLILVPRHFHWQQELIQKLNAQSLRYALWTAETEVSDVDALFERVDVLVVCTLGVLFSLYQIATMYCLGGTFVPVGGHNLLEPAVWGKPCIIGPHYHMCFDMAEQLYEVGGLMKTTSSQELFEVFVRLARNACDCKIMGEANLHLVAGCAAKTKEQLFIFIQKDL